MEAQDLKAKRNDILRIADKHGVRNVRIFGSVDRGESDEMSDLDLWVSPGPRFTILDQAAMIRELETLLEIKVDVVSDRGLRKRMRERVLREAAPL